MSEEALSPIQIPIIIDDSKIPGQMETIGKNIEKSSSGAKLAVSGLADKFGDWTREMTGSNQMGRKVENMAESLFAKLGAGAVVLGGLGTVIGIGTFAWSKYQESQEKAREETLKSAQAAMGWVDAARIQKYETEELRAANDALWKAERERNKFNLEQGIKAEEQKIKETEKLVNDRKQRLSGSDTGSSGLFIMIYGKKETREKDFRDAEISLQEHNATLLKMKASLKEANGGNIQRNAPEPPNDLINGWLAWQSTLQKELRARQARDRQQDLDMEKAVLDQKKAMGIISMQDELAAEKVIFEKETDDRMAKMWEEGRTKEEIEAYKATSGIKWKTHEYQEEQKINALRLQAAQVTAGNMAQASSLMYQQGGKHARQWFDLYKAAAVSEAIINIVTGATKAFKDYPWPYSAIVAGSVIAAGSAQIEVIRQQQFGSSSGAVGTYSANSATGLPSSDQGDNYRYFNYEQSTYGTGWRPGEGQGSRGDTYIINTMDSKSFDEYMMQNAKSVKKANDFAAAGYA